MARLAALQGQLTSMRGEARGDTEDVADVADVDAQQQHHQQQAGGRTGADGNMPRGRFLSPFALPGESQPASQPEDSAVAVGQRRDEEGTAEEREEIMAKMQQLQV